MWYLRLILEIKAARRSGLRKRLTRMRRGWGSSSSFSASGSAPPQFNGASHQSYPTLPHATEEHRVVTMMLLCDRDGGMALDRIHERRPILHPPQTEIHLPNTTRVSHTPTPLPSHISLYSDQSQKEYSTTWHHHRERTRNRRWLS